MSVLIVLGVILAVAAVLAWGSASIRSGLYLPALCRGERHERTVALTFDDGPDPRHTPALLDVLARHGVQATFFLIGERAAAHPDLVRRMVAEGHLIGNHSLTHANRFPLMNPRRMEKELRSTQETLHRITGLRTRLFRPPFGVTNPTIGRVTDRLRLTVIGWSIRSLDTVSRTPRQRILSRILRKLHPGAVILLHDRCPQCAELTDRLLDELRHRHYSTRTVEQLFGIAAYED